MRRSSFYQYFSSLDGLALAMLVNALKSTIPRAVFAAHRTSLRASSLFLRTCCFLDVSWPYGVGRLRFVDSMSMKDNLL